MQRLLKNPYVLGGAAILGVIVFMSRGKSTNAPAYSDIMSANNAAASNAFAASASMNAQIVSEQIKTNAIRDTALIGAASNNFAVATNQAVQLAESNAGIFKTQIQTQGAVQIDRQQNNARLGMAQIQDWGMTTRTLADTNAKVSLARSGMQLALVQSALGAGVQIHTVDVTSHTAEQIASIQADAVKTVSANNAFAQVARAKIQGETQKAVSSNNMVSNIAGSALGTIGNIFRGSFAPTSASAR